MLKNAKLVGHGFPEFPDEEVLLFLEIPYRGAKSVRISTSMLSRKISTQKTHIYIYTYISAEKGMKRPKIWHKTPKSA